MYKPLRLLYIYLKNKLYNKPTLVHVSLQVTRACNIKCTYCYASAGRKLKNELSTEEIKDLILDLKQMGLFILVFDGGEPLLRKDLEELIKFASDLKILTSVATNGVLLTKERAESLKNAGLNVFHFSIDGSTANIHSKTRGDSFNALLKGINNAVDTGLRVIAQTVITKHNKDDLENIIRLLMLYEVKAIRFHPVVPCGRGIEYPDKINVEELFEKVWELSKIYGKRIRIDFHDLPSYKKYLYDKVPWYKKIGLILRGGCGVKEGIIINIDADGSIRACPHFPTKLPNVNIREQKIMDIFYNNPILKQYRANKENKFACGVENA